MASDPFHTFAASVRSSLTSARTLSQSYREAAASSASSSSSSRTSIDLIPLRDRLEDAIEALRSDLDDVRQSVQVVQKSPERFGVDEGELRQRQRFLSDCEREMEQLERSAATSGPRHAGGHSSIDMDNAPDRTSEDPYTTMELTHQAGLLDKQDSLLSSIGNTLSSLQRQATNMGQEVVEQSELVQALDSEVESSQSRLGRAMTRMDEMVRRGDDRLGGWCVWLLVIALFFLLLIAIII